MSGVQKIKGNEIEQIARDMERWWSMTHVSPSHAARIDTLLDAALDLDESERADFLKTVPLELRGELDQLLKADAAESVLDSASTEFLNLVVQASPRYPVLPMPKPDPEKA